MSWALQTDRSVCSVALVAKRLKPVERRADIVNAALSILAREGASALTASRLCEAAGVSRGNLFHHFESLDAVVLEAFELALSSLGSLADAPMSLRAWLLAVGADAQDFTNHSPEMMGVAFAFMARARSDEPLRERMGHVLELGIESFSARLAGSLPNGIDTHAFATALLIAADGMAMHRHVFPERAGEQAAAWRALVDTIAPEAGPLNPTSLATVPPSNEGR